MNTDREHLDAETVAAWMDGALTGAPLAAAEAHASNCERCQALLATVARTLPPDDVRTAAGGVAWWKWLAPIAATAAAVTVWMVVPQDSMQPPASTAQSDVAALPAAPRESIEAAPAPQSPAGPARSPASPAPAREARFDDARRGASAAKEAKQRSDAQSNKLEAAASDRQEKAGAALGRTASAPAAPPPAPVAEAVTVAPAAPGVGAAAQRHQGGTIEIASPDPRRRWRTTTQGTVEHSLDGGITWVPVRLTAGEAITAGNSPSALVCWLVGRQGLVLLATDGTNFTRLPFPVAVDLVSVAATDARRATVVTVDGRTFHTEDNGRNWRNP